MRAEVEADAPRSRPLSRADLPRAPSTSKLDDPLTPHVDDDQSEWARQEQQVRCISLARTQSYNDTLYIDDDTRTRPDNRHHCWNPVYNP